MGKNQRRNHKVRQQRWQQAGVLACTYEPLVPGDRQLVRQLWRLYKLNGDRNGQLGELGRAGLRTRVASWGVAGAAWLTVGCTARLGKHSAVP